MVVGVTKLAVSHGPRKYEAAALMLDKSGPNLDRSGTIRRTTKWLNYTIVPPWTLGTARADGICFTISEA